MPAHTRHMEKGHEQGVLVEDISVHSSEYQITLDEASLNVYQFFNNKIMRVDQSFLNLKAFKMGMALV